jgi:hypothetical protein
VLFACCRGMKSGELRLWKTNTASQPGPEEFRDTG